MSAYVEIDYTDFPEYLKNSLLYRNTEESNKIIIPRKSFKKNCDIKNIHDFKTIYRCCNYVQCDDYPNSFYEFANNNRIEVCYFLNGIKDFTLLQLLNKTVISDIKWDIFTTTINEIIFVYLYFYVNDEIIYTFKFGFKYEKEEYYYFTNIIFLFEDLNYDQKKDSNFIDLIINFLENNQNFNEEINCIICNNNIFSIRESLSKHGDRGSLITHFSFEITKFNRNILLQKFKDLLIIMKSTKNNSKGGIFYVDVTLDYVILLVSTDKIVNINNFKKLENLLLGLNIEGIEKYVEENILDPLLTGEK